LTQFLIFRRQNLSILRWSCARKERWCYACRDPQSLDFSSSDPNGNGTEDLEYQAEWPTCQSEDDPTKSDDTLFKVIFLTGTKHLNYLV